jgi:hypothetical protein
MSKLQDSDVVRIVREEYARKLKVLTEKIDMSVVSPELKVRDNEENQYTISRVGAWGVELKSVGMDGTISFKKVEKKDFEENYSTPVEARKEAAKDNKEKGNE